MLRGWSATNVGSWADCIAIDPVEDARKVANVLGFRAEPTFDPDILSRLDVAMLAIKPHSVAEAANAMSRYLPDRALVISVAAGVDLARLSTLFRRAHLIRAMPNSTAAVGESITAFVADDRVTAEQRTLARTLLAALGKVEEAPSEAHMDAVTAVSGSGPAYVYRLAEVLADAGVALGLETDMARRLARQTIIGAGRMLEQMKHEPEELRAAVSSPGGTTEAAMSVLDESDRLHQLMLEAVEAAAKRSRDLNT